MQKSVSKNVWQHCGNEICMKYARVIDVTKKLGKML